MATEAKLNDAEEARRNERWALYWAQYDYTRPISEALTAEFGVGFGATNTGGGCICIQSDDLPSGVYVLVGSGVDGPLWTGKERDNYHTQHGHYDGYGVGVYNAESGNTLADVDDVRAVTGADVVELVKQALELAAVADTVEDTYLRERTDIDGNTTREWRNA